ncbi:MAG: hypothetical protein HYT80_01930 [Euryarchaeota archaeon]|nr:hypothetical protein [Euryarchaeota archaeon]
MLRATMREKPPEFSVREALASINTLEGIEPLLRARTEGLTTMLWGLITAAIFFSYQVVHAGAGHEGNMWLGFLWLPWVAAGISGTVVLWRSALVSAGQGAGWRRGLRGGLPFIAIFLVVLAGALLAYFVIGDLGRLHEPGYMTLVLGVAAFGLAAAPIPRSTRITRIVHVVAGLLAVFAALMVAYVVRPAAEDTAFLAQTLVGAFSVGGAWFVGGLIQAAKR